MTGFCLKKSKPEFQGEEWPKSNSRITKKTSRKVIKAIRPFWTWPIYSIKKLWRKIPDPYEFENSGKWRKPKIKFVCSNQPLTLIFSL